MDKTADTRTMTVAHPYWREFVARLDSREGCHFRLKVPMDEKSLTWKCKGGQDHTYARRILKRMGLTPAAIASSLVYFREHGGFCDCEILFNVEDSVNAKAAAVVREYHECLYCNREVEGPEGPVPALEDDEEWRRLAALHEPGCDWIETRAHRLKEAL